MQCQIGAVAAAERPVSVPDQDCHAGLIADNEEELFDIVDDSNQVVGREKRSIVHVRGLKHRAVYCFVFDSQGCLLMQQRSPK